jgi:tripartite-type tricarboxylate transporter receptor subunit TctC
MRRIVLALSCLCFCAPLFAQQYPNRPVRIIIPFPVGSAADIIVRAMEPQMRERLGQSIVVDNRGGAAGNIAGELTARATPDGYTVMMATIGTHAINHALYSKVNFNPIRDFTPVLYVGDSPNVLVMQHKLPASSVKELIALLKAKPGQYNYGSSGSGTTVHLSGELFNSMAGVKAVHVPFKGASEALTGLLGGQTDFMFASASSAIPQVKGGKLKALAVTGAQRIKSMPDLPTMSEAALPGYATAAWYGLVGPAGLPQPAVSTLAKAALSSIDTKEVRDRFFASGVEAAPASAEEFGKFIKAELDKWTKVIKAAGLKAD